MTSKLCIYPSWYLMYAKWTLVAFFVLLLHGQVAGQIQATQGAEASTENVVTGANTDIPVARHMDVLRLIWEDVERQAVGSEQRRKFLSEFLEKSSVVRDFPPGHHSAEAVWILRALAGLEMDQRRTAWEAGDSIVRLKAGGLMGEMPRKALAQLERSGLLDPQAPEPAKFAAEQKRLVAARQLANPVDAVQAEEILFKLILEVPDYTEAYQLYERITPWLIELRSLKESSPGQQPVNRPALLLSVRDRMIVKGLSSTMKTFLTANDFDKHTLAGQLMTTSDLIITRLPDEPSLWHYRAVAAVRLNSLDEGAIAGQQLLRLGAASSTDPSVISALEALKRKGWLKSGLVEERLAIKKAEIKTKTRERGEIEMRDAIDREDLAALKLFVDAGTSEMLKSAFFWTPAEAEFFRENAIFNYPEMDALTYSVLKKRRDVTQQLLRDKFGWKEQALLLACANGDKEAAKIILESGTKVKETRASIAGKDRPWFNSALMNAAWAGNVDVVSLLLAHGAPINETPVNAVFDIHGPTTALHLAVFRGHAEVVETLLKNGASLDGEVRIYTEGKLSGAQSVQKLSAEMRKRAEREPKGAERERHLTEAKRIEKALSSAKR